jgi:hypothetical protein
MLNNPLPSPLNNDADIEPLTFIEPVNCEPLAADITLNLCPSATDAVTLALAINGAAAA